MTNSTIASHLRQLRLDRHLTQAFVAAKLGISINHLCNLEQGKRRWYADTMTDCERVLSENKPEETNHD